MIYLRGADKRPERRYFVLSPPKAGPFSQDGRRNEVYLVEGELQDRQKAKRINFSGDYENGKHYCRAMKWVRKGAGKEVLCTLPSGASNVAFDLEDLGV